MNIALLIFVTLFLFTCSVSSSPLKFNITQYLPSSQYTSFKQQFTKFLNQTFDTSNCISSHELIGNYTLHLSSYNLTHIRSPLTHKLLLASILSQFPLSLIFPNLSLPLPQYQLCISLTSSTPPIFSPSPTPLPLKRSPSVKNTLSLYPYLLPHLSSSSITHLLSLLPLPLKQLLYLARYTISNKTIYRQIYNPNDIWNEFPQRLKKLHKHLPDADFIIYLSDTIHENLIHEYLLGEIERMREEGKEMGLEEYDRRFEAYKRVIVELPAFMWSKDLKNTLEFNKLLLVDNLVGGEAWGRTYEEVKEGARQVDWECKIEKGYFRGTLHEQDTTNTRAKLAQLSYHYPQYLNAKLFTYNPSNPLCILPSDLLSPHQDWYPSPITTSTFSPISTHLHFKYLFSLDTVTASWHRLPWHLLSSSLVFKQDSSKIQWYYHRLKPYVNYIPVKQDLYDVVEQIEYARKNDGLMRRIAREGRMLAEDLFGEERVFGEFAGMLREYAEAQRESMDKEGEEGVRMDELRVGGMEEWGRVEERYEVRYQGRDGGNFWQDARDNTGNIVQGVVCVVLVAVVIVWKVVRGERGRRIDEEVKRALKDCGLIEDGKKENKNKDVKDEYAGFKEQQRERLTKSSDQEETQAETNEPIALQFEFLS